MANDVAVRTPFYANIYNLNGLWRAAACAGLIVVVGLIAYSNSMHGPLVFDDVAAIDDNPSLSPLWPLSGPLHPPAYRTVTGRPVANLTLAFNHALGGVNPVFYHAVNLLIHLGAALLLFGILGRTLSLPMLQTTFGADARGLALATAVVWAVHPLQTESVTYIVQRVESLMGFFYFATLYCFIRGATGGTRTWFWLAVIGCLLGMGTKEVMVSAPLMVLLYDRTFLSGSFRVAWRQRRIFYSALAATWALLFWLVIGSGSRSGSAGFNVGIGSWDYGLTQFQAIIHYLRLSYWPSPLIIDYGTHLVRSPWSIWPQGIVLVGLAGMTARGIWRGSAFGFVGFWFFAILAPSSSVVPVVTQSMAEHRMYLSLAAVIVVTVACLYRLFGRRTFLLWMLVSMACIGLTRARNDDYRSTLILWRDNIAKCPQNPRGYDALGNALSDEGMIDEAIIAYQAGLSVDPLYVESLNNLGVAFHKRGRSPEAIAAFSRALAINPNYAGAHYNLGNVLAEAGRAEEARSHYLAALHLTPDEPTTLLRLGTLEMQLNDPFAAEAHLRAAIKAAPRLMEARFNLGFLVATQGRWDEAQNEMRLAVKEDPRSAMAHYNLANALAQAGRLSDAAVEYATATKIDSSMVPAHYNLGNTYALLGRYDDAVHEYESVLSLEPEHPRAAQSLAAARLRQAGAASGR